MQTKHTEPSFVQDSINVLKGTPGLSITGAERAEITLSCHDGDDIPRVTDAGKTVKVDGETVQVMHNGLYVAKGYYQGDWQAGVIAGLKGIHEPQEEKVFYEVLKRVGKQGAMIELGSWWSYYSMWFLKAIDGGRVICCEPDPENILIGQKNMKLNGFDTTDRAVFYPTAAGSEDKKIIKFKSEIDREETAVTIRTVDSIMKEQKIDELSILHMDIQGVELDALRGAQKSIKAGKVRFLFVSTHHYLISGDPLTHQKCLAFIKENGGQIVSEHTIAESCSGDGLIVAAFQDRDKDFTVTTSLQHTDNSLFRQPERDLGLLWRAHDGLLEQYNHTEKQLQQTQQKLAAERQANDVQGQHVRWMNAHPLRFAIGNLYHVHLRRDRPKDQS